MPIELLSGETVIDAPPISRVLSQAAYPTSKTVSDVFLPRRLNKIATGFNVTSSSGYLRRSTGIPSGWFTIAGWYKLRALRGTWQSVCSIENNGQTQSYSLLISSGNQVILYKSGAQYNTYFTPKINTWYYWTLALGPVGEGVPAMFFNCWLGSSLITKFSVGSGTDNVTRTYLYLMNDSYGTPEWVDGTIAKARVWSAQLSTEELWLESRSSTPFRYKDLVANLDEDPYNTVTGFTPNVITETKTVPSNISMLSNPRFYSPLPSKEIIRQSVASISR